MSVKVILVDDSPERTREATAHLGALGYDVQVAPTAQDALKQLSSDSAQLLVTHWYLEDMLLHDFAEHAKHVNGDCAFLVYFENGPEARPRGVDDPYVDSFFPFNHLPKALVAHPN
ncbi:MAG: hypothetical protein GF320_19940 [Armatimonadia bacterium]|nr:hypothetical protein [Armatimonadia bacterium]